ncbi:MAG: baseplate J/gp47 family protein, partial [Fibrobacterales bacterium]|nr:baseplate J/gp47 family protein [Fibrobacterales bacterium]
MAFPRPTVKQIYDRILADVRSGLGGPSLTRGVATTLAAAFAGAVWLCYLFLEWCYRMLLPTSSEGEYLDEWCKRYGIERKVASCALGTARFHGAEGAVIAEGTEILRGDGVRYATTAAATIAAGETTATAPIRAT